MQHLLLKAIYVLGLTGLAIQLSYAQFDPLPYSHTPGDPRLWLIRQAKAASDCLMITENTILQADAACIFVSDGVALDLSGHTVSGNIVGIDVGRGITIKNGTVVKGAIVLLGANNLLDMVTVRDSELTFAVQIGSGVVDRSVFERNIVAVDLFFGGSVEVHRSVFDDNEIGVNISSDSHSQVYANVFKANKTGVRLVDEDFEGASGNMISHNTFRENGIGVFIDARSDANDNYIQDNLFFFNESSAIVVRLACDRMFTDQCAGRGTQINRNWLAQNGGQAQLLSGAWTLSTGEQKSYEVALGDGLTVVALPEPGVADGASVTGNVAFFNANFGLEAPGVVDGGENYAANNGNPEQCVGVQCQSLGSNGGPIPSHE